jgi:transcriptional regulator with XRE-family HTH domain
MTFSERIRLIRQQKKISQNDLSKAAGINVKSLSRYELGTSVPPANALKAIADALGVSADSLLCDDTTQIKDKELFKKFEAIQDMGGDTKKMIINFLDIAIRDYKAKQAYIG